MKTNRVEALSDGMIAIIITIMVLQMQPPKGADLASLIEIGPLFLVYLLSFLMLGIYWNNHHHVFQAARKVNGNVMWANLHLMFWLSLVPFVTHWVGEQAGMAWPAAAYGVVMLGAGAAFTIMLREIVKLHGDDSSLARAIGDDSKGKISVIGHTLGTIGAFINPWVSYFFYASVAIMWIVPDQRIEQSIQSDSG